MTTPYKAFIASLSDRRAYYTLSGAGTLDELLGHDLTKEGSPTLGVDLGFRQGSSDDYGVTFSGTTQAFSTAHYYGLDPYLSDWSVAFWIANDTDSASIQYLVSHSGGGGANEWDVRRQSSLLSGRFGGITLNQPADHHSTTSTPTFVVLNLDRDGSATWYLNGSANGTPTDISSLSATNIAGSNTFYIARRSATGYFAGTLGQVVVRAALWTAQNMTDAMAAYLKYEAPAQKPTATGAGYSATVTALAGGGTVSAERPTATGAAYNATGRTGAGAFAPRVNAYGWASQGDGSDLDVVVTQFVEAVGVSHAATANVQAPAQMAEVATAVAAAEFPYSGSQYDEGVYDGGEYDTLVGPRPAVGVVAGDAAQIFTAFANDATVTVFEGQATNVAAPMATATAVAYDAISTAARAEATAGTGAAYDVAPAVAPDTQVASATAEALSALQAYATSAIATATGAAYGIHEAIDVHPAAISATGVASQTSQDVRANAELASATGSAAAAAMAVAFHPEVASALGASYIAHLGLETGAGLASALGAAWVLEHSATAPAGLASATCEAWSNDPGIGVRPGRANVVFAAYDLVGGAPPFITQSATIAAVAAVTGSLVADSVPRGVIT